MKKDLILAKDLPALFRIPAGVDWRQGANRAVGQTAQIEAKDDMAAINAWLMTYENSKQTFASYRKEAIRLFLWAAHTRGKSISDLSHEDMTAYRKFIADPQPASKWVSQPAEQPKEAAPTKPDIKKTPPKAPKVGISDPRWRPFYGPLSPASQRQAMVILDAMLTWLVDAKYLAGNPLALSRHRNRSTKGNQLQTRVLEPNQIQMVLSVIEQLALAGEKGNAAQANARRRWAVVLLYLTGLRISEAVLNTMGGFHQVRSSGGTRQWWLKIKGKGSREDDIPVTPELMRELQIYREAFGLSAIPRPNETIPLVFSLGPARKPIARQTLHTILKETFEKASILFEKNNQPEDAVRLEVASAHWLRHSLGTNLVHEGMNIAQVRDVMRHSNLATTNRYVHTKADARHGEMSDKHKLPEKES